MSDRLLADLIVAIHVIYVAFVLFGQILILIGIWRGWQWVRNPWFRILHLTAILIVAAEAILNITCPLTSWEAALRERAGQGASDRSFIGGLLHELIFFEAPDWAFNLSYILFAILVALTFWFAPPRLTRNQESGIRSRGSGVRSQESGVGDQTATADPAVTRNGLT
jgi:hypothetical protein